MPNIVFILADDLGCMDTGFAGSDFHETPNLDLLFKESFHFARAYSASPVCSPSRASILTGRHPVRTGITDWIPGDEPANRNFRGPVDLHELPLAEKTLAEYLSQAGYQCFFAGKWHLGAEGYLPTDQGFAQNVGGHEKGSPPGGYYVPYKNPKLPDGPEGEYLTDRLTSESIHFIRNSGNKPFFLFLSFYTVHTPIQPNRQFVGYFTEKLDKMPDPAQKTVKDLGATTTQNQRDPAYASMVRSMDENIGRLINAIKEENLYENTVIVFTSDNGGLTTLGRAHQWSAPTSVQPLRAGKGWLFEGGIRVPLLYKPAENTSPQKEITTPVCGYDIFPTLLQAAGLEADPKIILDGKDLHPLMEGKDFEREVMYWHYPHYHTSGWTPGSAIIKGSYKLIKIYESGKIKLYDLENDPGERTDLSESHKEVADDLQRSLHEWLIDNGALFPSPNNPVKKNQD